MDAYDYLVEHRDSVANIPDTTDPGVYAIFAHNPSCLEPIQISRSGIVYVGLAKDLEQRNHFKAASSGFHSPRRSFGAILKDRLNLKAIPRSNGKSKTNYDRYSFEEDGERRLTEWMWTNLEYSICPYQGDIKQLERELIEFAEPPVNLTLWKNPQKKVIQELRNLCKDEARAVWLRERVV